MLPQRQYNPTQIYTLPSHPKSQSQTPKMSNITQITSHADNASLVSRAESTGKPTIIYVSNSTLPLCKVFSPKFYDLASQFNTEREGQVEFAQIEFSSETSMLFKFSPNQLPVLVFMGRDRGMGGGGKLWCKTVMGADLEGLEQGVEEMMGRAGLRANRS
jgi:hypothetical protein